MSIWRKFQDLFDNTGKGETGSDNTEYHQEQKDHNQSSFEDLEQLVKPLIRQATKLEVGAPMRPKENSQMLSHVGGQPYFEKGETWPRAKSGKHLSFIFQVFNNGKINLPDNIKLVQFFYDWDEFPWETESDGWLVKIYESLNPNLKTNPEKPAELGRSKYCEITFQPVQSLPDWEGICIYSDEASKLSGKLNEENPWDAYQKVAEKLVGEQGYRSQFGGYPKWVQGEDTPLNANGEPMKLLFQIDSENNADIMWGDVGLIYVFYDETTRRIEFTLQCH